jgi:hypothetical protein
MGSNNKSQKKSGQGGTLMSMRSGMQKVAGTKPSGGKRSSKWTFPQVLLATAGVAALLAIVYAMRN